MKTFLKYISLILVCILLLSACSSSEYNTEDEKTQKDVIKKLQGIETKPATTITLYTHSVYVKKEVNRAMEELNRRLISELGIELKLKEYPNGAGNTSGTIMDYEVESIEKDYKLKNPCDMYIVGWDMVSKLAPKGILMDLTELLPKYAPNYYRTIDGVVDPFLISHNDRLVAVPPYAPTSRRYYVAVRSDIAEIYNVKEINNLSDYGALLERIKKDDNSAIPMDTGLFGNSDAMHLYGLSYMDGYMVYRVNDPEKQVIAWEDTSEFYDIMNMLNEWGQKGYIDRKSNKNTETVLLPLNSADGWYGMTGKDARYRLYPLNSDVTNGIYAPAIPAIAVNSNSKNVEAVLQFIEWIHFNQENYDLLMYGIEGADYTLEDGRIKFDDNKSRYYNSWSVFLECFKDMELDRVAGSGFTNYEEAYDMELQGNYVFAKGIRNLVFSDGAKKIINERDNLFKSLMESVLNGRPASEWHKILDKIKETDDARVINEIKNQMKD